MFNKVGINAATISITITATTTIYSQDIYKIWLEIV